MQNPFAREEWFCRCNRRREIRVSECHFADYWKFFLPKSKKKQGTIIRSEGFSFYPRVAAMLLKNETVAIRCIFINGMIVVVAVVIEGLNSVERGCGN